MDTVIPGNESKQLAAALVDKAVQDKVLNDITCMKARIAEALEASWQQGLSDAETWARVARIRKLTC